MVQLPVRTVCMGSTNYVSITLAKPYFCCFLVHNLPDEDGVVEETPLTPRGETEKSVTNIKDLLHVSSLRVQYIHS